LGGPIGGAAAPGMEQDAGSAQTDVHDISLQLTCIPGSFKNFKTTDDTAGGDNDTGFTSVSNISAVGAIFTLKLSFNYMSQRVLRIVDVDRQEYKQVATNSLGDARVEWTKAVPQNIEVFSTNLAPGEAHQDFKPCQNNCSASAELKHLPPCQRSNSCTAFGFNYRSCEVLDPNEDDITNLGHPI
jgi:hypothetical protein